MSTMKTRPDRSVLMTPEEAADFLRTTTNVLATWRCRKSVNLPYIKLGRAIRYDFDDLVRFLEASKVHRVEPRSSTLGVV